MFLVINDQSSLFSLIFDLPFLQTFFPLKNVTIPNRHLKQKVTKKKMECMSVGGSVTFSPEAKFVLIFFAPFQGK